MKKDKANKALALALKVAKPNSAFNTLLLTGEHLIANNCDMALELEFPVDLDFPVVVDGTDLKNAIAGLRDKEVSFEYKNEALYLNSKVRVPLYPSDDLFPKMPHVGLKKESGYLRLSGSFSQLYKETTPHRSKDVIRPNRMRVYLATNGAMWATNEYTAIMIADVVISHESDMLDAEALPASERGIMLPLLPCDFLPDATLEGYVADCPQNDRGKEVIKYDRIYVIEDAEKKFYFKRFEGGYPQIPSVVPDRGTNKVFMTVDADALNNALLEAIAAVKLSKDVEQCSFTQRRNGIELVTVNIDMDKSYINSVAASFNKVDDFADDMRFGANMRLFSNCLASFKGKSVEIGYSQPNRAICFYDATRPELTMLCMPVLINPVED